MNHNTRGSNKIKKGKKKNSNKNNNTINLILTLNYYAGQSQE